MDNKNSMRYCFWVVLFVAGFSLAISVYLRLSLNNALNTITEQQERIEELEQITGSTIMSCPYCCSNEVRIVEHMGQKSFYSIVCDHCGFEGPCANDITCMDEWFDKEEAIRAWNELPRKSKEEQL